MKFALILGLVVGLCLWTQVTAEGDDFPDDDGDNGELTAGEDDGTAMEELREKRASCSCAYQNGIRSCTCCKRIARIRVCGQVKGSRKRNGVRVTVTSGRMKASRKATENGLAPFCAKNKNSGYTFCFRFPNTRLTNHELPSGCISVTIKKGNWGKTGLLGCF